MLQFLNSTIGRKYLMGITGLVWMGFIFTHMAANMLILFSSDYYNSYGHAIVANKPLLFFAEFVLVAAMIIHVVCAISLTRKNRIAQGATSGSRYVSTPSGQKASSWASQYMAVQGSLILVFIILHLITFKYGNYYETTVNGVVMRDLHKLVLEVFQSPTYVVWYIVCLVLLMFHLSHGASSIFQSFGFLERKMQSSIKKLAWVYAVIVIAGFLSQPLYVFVLNR